MQHQCQAQPHYGRQNRVLKIDLRPMPETSSDPKDQESELKSRQEESVVAGAGEFGPIFCPRQADEE